MFLNKIVTFNGRSLLTILNYGFARFFNVNSFQISIIYSLKLKSSVLLCMIIINVVLVILCSFSIYFTIRIMSLTRFLNCSRTTPTLTSDLRRGLDVSWSSIHIVRRRTAEKHKRARSSQTHKKLVFLSSFDLYFFWLAGC